MHSCVLGLDPLEQKDKALELVSDNWLPTVWQGTVSGLWLGAVAAVCLICLLKSSTQSCRSCLWVQITCRRSNIVPAKAETADDESAARSWTAVYLNVFLPFSSKAFLCASQSSSLDTVMPARGNFPCRLDSDTEIQFKPQSVYRRFYL